MLYFKSIFLLIYFGFIFKVLAGHEAPVSSVSFSPVDVIVATTSWDKTVRFWHVYESKTTRETITLTADGTVYVLYILCLPSYI